jgi:hypothetical protein
MDFVGDFVWLEAAMRLNWLLRGLQRRGWAAIPVFVDGVARAGVLTDNGG